MQSLIWFDLIKRALSTQKKKIFKLLLTLGLGIAYILSAMKCSKYVNANILFYNYEKYTVDHFFPGLVNTHEVDSLKWMQFFSDSLWPRKLALRSLGFCLGCFYLKRSFGRL